MRDGMGNGSGIEDGVTVEHTGNILMTSSAKVYFRDSGLYINSDADGSLSISADGTSGNTVKIKLNDKSGNTNFTVLDSDGFPMGQLDSDGNLKHKGAVKRTTTN